MNDARNYFTAQTGDAVGANTFHLGTNVLQIDPWDEPGRGTPKFINVWAKDFTTAADVCSIDLLSSSAAAPAAGDEVLGLAKDLTLAVLSLGGLIAKVPLPSKGLDDYLNIYFTAETAVTTGGLLTAFLTLD